MHFVLLRTREEVEALSEQAERLLQQIIPAPNATYTPRYFLPRLEPANAPRVLVCYENNHLIGIVYTYEILVCGMKTGFYFGGDQMGRGLILCAPDREKAILSAACDYLLEHGAHAMRLQRTPLQPGPSKLHFARPRTCCKATPDPRIEGDWLHLAADYDAFLTTLGPHTRRNLRYYRRKLEAAGYTYTGILPAAEFDTAMQSLNELADYPMEPERLARDHRYFAAFKTPIIAGLRSTSSGEYVSLVTGFTAGQHLHILTQLNRESEDLRRFSLSLVLRGYLIEDFIARGYNAVHFMQGSSPMLGRFCEPVDLHHLSIDDRSFLMTPFKRLCSTLAAALSRNGKRVPHRLQWAAGSFWD